jgi:hypothetical protein
VFNGHAIAAFELIPVTQVVGRVIRVGGNQYRITDMAHTRQWLYLYTTDSRGQRKVVRKLPRKPGQQLSIKALLEYAGRGGL